MSEKRTGGGMTPSLPMVIQRLREAEERERILQQQNDAFDAMGADLTAALVASEARCNEYVAQNMRQAQRLAALEGAAREMNDLVFRGFRYTDTEIKKAHKRLSELLEKGN